MKDYNKLVKMFKAFSDESRLKILEILLKEEKCSCEICANDLLEKLDIGQSTLSHHMKMLTDPEIVIAKKKSKRTYYIINMEKINYFINLLNKLIINKQEDDYGNI